jgi:hypothetical protein
VAERQRQGGQRENKIERERERERETEREGGGKEVVKKQVSR